MNARPWRLLPVFALLAGCASGAAMDAPAPPAAPAPPPAVAEEPPPDIPPELRAGSEVDDIRLTRRPITLGVGEAVSMAELEPTPVDASGNPVPAPLMAAPLGGEVATLDTQGMIRGLAEGEAELLLAVMAAGPTGLAQPRFFSVPIIVLGEPVASIEVLPPELSVYTGTAVPFGVAARTEGGDLRTRVEISWTSRNPDIASVGQNGFVRGHRAGTAALAVSSEGVEVMHLVEVLENPVRSIEFSPTTPSSAPGTWCGSRRFRGPPTARPSRISRSPTRSRARGCARGSAPRSTRTGPSSPSGRAATASSRARGRCRRARSPRWREREVAQAPDLVGNGLTYHTTSADLWVFRGVDGRDYAYVGTHEGGQKMYAWDVTDPAAPVLTDSVVVDARIVNDVKVNGDATIAVITREGASDRRNGIVLLDLADPAHPAVITDYTEGLTGGVHNTFIVDDLVYAIHDGTLDVHIIDISDASAPEEVGRWGIDNPGKYLHDIWVLDGIAYVSYWGDGVWLLDVGNGGWGGTPTEPAVISSYAYPEGHTHVAFPYRNAEGRTYLFVGDEIFDCAECTPRTTMGERVSRGFIHILSIDDPENPVEVGRYEVPEAGAHNIWVEDDRLYVAYYQGGLRVVDVSGELRGDLYRQGREIAWFPTGHPAGNRANSPDAWGPQPYLGNIFVSDMNSGLWVVRLEPPEDAPLFP